MLRYGRHYQSKKHAKYVSMTLVRLSHDYVKSRIAKMKQHDKMMRKTLGHYTIRYEFCLAFSPFPVLSRFQDLISLQRHKFYIVLRTERISDGTIIVQSH